jgi:hypothetical protein
MNYLYIYTFIVSNQFNLQFKTFCKISHFSKSSQAESVNRTKSGSFRQCPVRRVQEYITPRLTPSSSLSLLFQIHLTAPPLSGDSGDLKGTWDTLPRPSLLQGKVSPQRFSTGIKFYALKVMNSFFAPISQCAYY